MKIPSGGNRWAEGRGVKKGRDVKKKIQIRRKKDGVPFATQAAHFEQIKIWKVIDELKGLLCEAPGFFVKLLASFASHFAWMTPEVKSPSLVMKMNGADWSSVCSCLAEMDA